MTPLLELHPIGIYLLALGAGFLIPLLARTGRGLPATLFYLALIGMLMCTAAPLYQVLASGSAIEIETAGVSAPFAINLRFGAYEGWVLFWVNLAALLGAWQTLGRWHEQPGALSLYLILVMGVNGMVMTRDLFNLFIFTEITAIATYGVIGLRQRADALAAGFKYIIATSLASAFFLLGTILVYYLVGTLNIDQLIEQRQAIAGPIGFAALLLVLASLLVELKPFPANGWGLDVYQTAPGGTAALISVGVSSGVLFALWKLLPLLPDWWGSIAMLGGISFALSNLIGLKQTDARRLLGYSSVGQIGLITLAAVLLLQVGADAAVPLVVGGLFVNHLLAKAGLFWLADGLPRPIAEWVALADSRIRRMAFGALLVALVGLPPFPGFWAKWALVMELADAGMYGWIAVVLVGSLLEAAYLFRWFARTLRSEQEAAEDTGKLPQPASPVYATVLLLLCVGVITGRLSGLDDWILGMPLALGAALLLLDRLPALVRSLAMVAGVALGSMPLVENLDPLRLLFAAMLVGGGLVIAVAAGYRTGERRAGFYPLLGVLLGSLAVLVGTESSLGFFYAWELMTLSSYLLLLQGADGPRQGLSYLLFSLGAAFFVLAGFAVAAAASGSGQLADLAGAGDSAAVVFSLLALGFVIKAGGLGVHTWLPGAYAESDDDFSALISAVVSKASVFGLLLVASYLGTRSVRGLDPAYVLGWIGMLTATFGALMAVFQEDIKKLLAYSSMGQLGYVMTAAALMSHLGWTAAIYLAVNHLLFKGLLFLAVAGVILRTGTRLMYRTGGLINNMPFSFVAVLIGIIAMSGVPPLTGFGGKWLLFNALMDKHWHWLAVLALFSSAVAFLYLFRLIHTVFLGQRKHEHRAVREAPATLLVPQYVLIGIIMAFSIYPKLLLDPIAAAVDPVFGTSLSWQGLALVTPLGYWNAPLIMAIIGAVFMAPLLVLLLLSRFMRVQRVGQFNIVYAAERPDRPETTHYAYNFYQSYGQALGFLVRPRATAFWSAVSEWAHSAAASLRMIYTGNGQTYALYILALVAALYLLNGGAS